MGAYWSSRARVTPPRPGVLITNLGSPDAPAPRAVRRYLRQFLSDRRVVEAPRLPWWLLLNLVILPRRSHRSARKYEKIWTPGGSPLIAITGRLAHAMEREIAAHAGRAIPVRMGMRYGQPSLASGLRELAEAGCARILVLPLFPQRSATTTGSAIDATGRELARWRDVPTIRTISGYASDPRYIAALAASVRAHWRVHGRGQRLLLSFHGIPRRYADAGDPYPAECGTTASLLACELRLDDGSWTVSFQSRFGPETWLGPYTGATLERWGREGVAAADVLCPGFAADCLETLNEIAIEDRAVFNAAGGGELRYIPALNDTPAHVETLAAIALDNLAGWL